MSGIFISYRRSTSKHLARSIFMALQQRGHDVFLDVNSIDSGAFDGIILNQIAARPHFLLVLSSGALERCANEGDWLRQEIEEAFRLNRNIVPIFDEGYDLNREISYLPEPIRTQLPLKNAPPYSHYYFDAFIQTLSDRFFKDKVDNLPVIATPPAERAEVQKRIEQAAQPNDGWTPQIEVTDNPQPISPQTQAELSEFMNRTRQFEYELVPPTPSHPQMWGVENILPQPFEWVYIPAGYLTFNGERSFVDIFNISKYPITNAQFEVFVQAEDGYRNPKWWDFSKRSRLWREKNHIPQPRAFPSNDHPRVNVNRYEAIALCNWLAERFNSHAPELSPIKITLPTEQQWQRAALDDGLRLFPWGDNYDSSRGNTKESGIEGTTPVNHYPKGASPYGVIDTFGNVSEWCLNTEETSGNDIAAKLGGSWKSDIKNNNLWLPSSNYADDIGFRIVMMNS